MPKLDLKSGGFVGFVLLVVVIVLAIRAFRPEASSSGTVEGSRSDAA